MSNFNASIMETDKLDNVEPSNILIVWTFLLMVIGILIVIGNFTVLVAALRNKSLRENIHYNLVLSLTVCDLVYGVNAILYSLIYNMLKNTGLVLLTLCRINFCLGCLAYQTSVWQAFFISLNRYLVISERKLNEILWKGKRKYIVFFSIWAINLILYLSMLAPKDYGGQFNENLICNTETMYGDLFAVWNMSLFASVAFCLFFTFVFYTLTLYTVRQKYRNTSGQDQHSNTQNDFSHQMALRQRARFMKSMKLVSIVLGVMFLSLIPATAIGFLQNLSQEDLILLVCFTFFNSLVNPIVYCVQIVKVKTEIKKMFCLG